MENGNIIDTYADSDFQDHVESLSPEQAAQTAKNYINQTESDSAYYRTSHPDHRRAVERIQRLYVQAHAEDSDGTQFDSHGEELPEKLSPETQKMVKEAFEAEEAKVDKVRVQMEDDMDFLCEHGFERAALPETIEPFKANALRMQRLYVEGRKAEIPSIMQKELTELRAGPDIQELFRNLIATDSLDEGLQKGFFDQLLVWIFESREKQAKELEGSIGYAGTSRKDN